MQVDRIGAGYKKLQSQAHILKLLFEEHFKKKEKRGKRERYPLT